MPTCGACAVAVRQIALQGASELPDRGVGVGGPQPVARTGAEVWADLAQLEAVGYRPSTHDADYPNALMSAEAKVAAMQGHNAAYGGDQGGAQQVGSAGAQ